MVIYGSWLATTDGTTRPIVAVKLTTAGAPIDVQFVVDTGADRTVLTADLVLRTGLTPLPAAPGYRLEGVGGVVGFVTLGTVLIFITADGRPARVNGPFAAFTDPTALDQSVLGRDVLDNFDVILSRRRDEIALLAGNHAYRIEPSP